MQAHGMKWTRRGFFATPVPEWTVEPDLDDIRDEVKRYLSPGVTIIDVMLHGQGGLNKVYKVVTSDLTYALRVSLPLAVPDKVESEVATMRFLIKTVFAYEPSSVNGIGFPWILMSFLDAHPAGEVWFSLTPDQKSHLVCQLAQFSAELNRYRFKTIGGLREISSEPEESPQPGKFLSLERAYTQPESTSRPFKNSHDWLRTWLTDTLEYYRKDPFNPQEFEDEDDLAYARAIAAKTVRFAPRVLDILPKLFDAESQEETVLSAQDLHAGNLMIDENGTIVGVIDWEFVNAQPLWSACQPPRFFDYRNQTYEPLKEQHHGPNPSYVQEMRSWDMYSRYRKEYLDKMAELDPEWIEIYNAAQAEREMEEAFEELRSGFTGGTSDVEWLEKLQESLRSRGPLDPSKPVPLEDYESRYYDPFTGVETPE